MFDLPDRHLNIFEYYSGRRKKGRLIEDNVTKAFINVLDFMNQDKAGRKCLSEIWKEIIGNSHEGISQIFDSNKNNHEITFDLQVPKNDTFENSNNTALVVITTGETPSEEVTIDKDKNKKDKGSRPDAMIFDQENKTGVIIESKLVKNADSDQNNRHDNKFKTNKRIEITWKQIFKAFNVFENEVLREKLNGTLQTLIEHFEILILPLAYGNRIKIRNEESEAISLQYKKKKVDLYYQFTSKYDDEDSSPKFIDFFLYDRKKEKFERAWKNRELFLEAKQAEKMVEEIEEHPIYKIFKNKNKSEYRVFEFPSKNESKRIGKEFFYCSHDKKFNLKRAIFIAKCADVVSINRNLYSKQLKELGKVYFKGIIEAEKNNETFFIFRTLIMGEKVKHGGPQHMKAKKLEREFSKYVEILNQTFACEISKFAKLISVSRDNGFLD